MVATLYAKQSRSFCVMYTRDHQERMAEKITMMQARVNGGAGANKRIKWSGFKPLWLPSNDIDNGVLVPKEPEPAFAKLRYNGFSRRFAAFDPSKGFRAHSASPSCLYALMVPRRS